MTQYIGERTRVQQNGAGEHRKWGLTFHQEVMDSWSREERQKWAEWWYVNTQLSPVFKFLYHNCKDPIQDLPPSVPSLLFQLMMCFVFLEGERASVQRLFSLRFKDSLKICILPSVIDHQIKKIRYLTCKVFPFNRSQWFPWRSLTVSKWELLTFPTAPTGVQEKICKRSTTLWRWNLIAHWSW